MRIRELLEYKLVRKMGNFHGPFKVISFDPSTQTVEFQGVGKLQLTSGVKDLPKPGYNYAVEYSGKYVFELASLTVDNVITDGQSVLLIKRKNPPFAGHWALPGGFIDPGETPAVAAKRELAEETGLDLSGIKMNYLGKYAEKNRDPRMENVITFVYYTRIPREQVKAGDDASAAEWIDIDRLPFISLAFDHEKILNDALSN